MVSHSNKVLFIEGTHQDENGDLGKGFSTLLKQKLEGKMPRIIMGNGVSEVIDKYKNAQNIPIRISLIDLDGKGDSIRQGEYQQAKEEKRRLHKLVDGDLIYFMVQKMEAWFLSQPEVLKIHFKKEFNNIPFDHPSKIENPDDVLSNMTRDLKFKAYHKVRDGSRLLEKLNLSTLERTFLDVRELIERLN